MKTKKVIKTAKKILKEETPGTIYVGITKGGYRITVEKLEKK